MRVILILLSLSLFVKAEPPYIPVPVKDLQHTINKACDYLVSQRRPDGFYKGRYGHTTGCVALVGMAFLSTGSTPGKGKYGKDILRCFDIVVKDKEGDDWLNKYINSVSDVGDGERLMYSVVLSALFLTEVSGMLDAKRQKQSDMLLAKSLKFILDSQEADKKNFRDKYGWRYRGDSDDSDLSITGWCLMTLKSARLNGAQVPNKAIDKALKYVKSLRKSKTGGFGYWNKGTSGTLGMSGVALTCLELVSEHNTAYNRSIGDHILKNFRTYDLYESAPRSHDWCYYGIYYCGVGTFHLGGKYWKEYADWLYKKHMKTQNSNGAYGRSRTTYATAITVLTLTLPYQQLPIYQKHEGKLKE